MSRLSVLFASRRASLGCLLVLIAAVASSAAAPAHAQSYPKTFKLNFAWSYTNISQVPNIDQWPQATLKLNRNGSLDVFDGSTNTSYPSVGTWRQQGSQITFTFPTAIYTGQKQRDHSYIGSMSATNGMRGVWKGKFVP
jgi:hypothetical protein